MKNQTKNRNNWKKQIRKYFQKGLRSKMNKYELLALPENSLGFQLGSFLIQNGFEEQTENHDVIHVLTNTGISNPEEIGMQYYLLGNGKRSLTLFISILIGTISCPLHWPYFKAQFSKGKQAHYFHYLDFSSMLTIPVNKIRQTFKIQ